MCGGGPFGPRPTCDEGRREFCGVEFVVTDMPKYKYHCFVCTNARPPSDPRGCCAAKGSEGLRNTLKEAVHRRGLKGTVRINAAGCLDACAKGPAVVIYPEGVWYTLKSGDDALELVERHFLLGEIVERLRMPR